MTSIKYFKEYIVWISCLEFYNIMYMIQYYNLWYQILKLYILYGCFANGKLLQGCIFRFSIHIYLGFSIQYTAHFCVRNNQDCSRHNA